jgi:hypothetical protein
MTCVITIFASFALEHLMHCTIVISAHFMHTLDRIHAEPDSEIQKEQVQKAWRSTRNKLCGY